AGQWTYRGIPLYTFSGDHKPTDAYGVYQDYGPWRVMFLSLDAFPGSGQGVASVGDAKIFAAPRGLRLHGRAFRMGQGAWVYRVSTLPYAMGYQTIRTRWCDAACLKIRHPLLAPADAQPKGHWMVYSREDGSKQWAFQGFALYS